MPLLAVAAVLLAGCASAEERACDRADELYKVERAAGKTPAVGWSTESRDACLAKLKELATGPRECLSRCYLQARDVGGLFDCERTCPVK